MHGTSTKAERPATKRTVRLVSENFRQPIALPTSDIPVRDDSEWFAEMAQALLAPDRGLALHLLTGLGDERQCARYVNGAVKPSGYFVRRLFRLDEGEPFAAFALDGVPWWNDLRRHADIGRKVLDITRVEG